MSNDIQCAAVYITSIQSIHVNATAKEVIQRLRRLSSSALLVQTMLQDEDPRPSHHQTTNLLRIVNGVTLATPAAAMVPTQVVVETKGIFVDSFNTTKNPSRPRSASRRVHDSSQSIDMSFRCRKQRFASVMAAPDHYRARTGAIVTASRSRLGGYIAYQASLQRVVYPTGINLRATRRHKAWTDL